MGRIIINGITKKTNERINTFIKRAILLLINTYLLGTPLLALANGIAVVDVEGPEAVHLELSTVCGDEHATFALGVLLATARKRLG